MWFNLCNLARKVKLMRYAAGLFGAMMAAGVAAPAVADMTRFDGTYRLFNDGAPCVVGEGDVAGAAFRIEKGRLFGIESTCTLANPTNIRDMDAMLFDLQCVGEGLNWSDRIFLMKMDDGSLLYVVDKSAFTYAPCRPSE